MSETAEAQDEIKIAEILMGMQSFQDRWRLLAEKNYGVLMLQMMPLIFR